MASFLVRPGSLLLIILVGVMLFGLFNWASDTLSQSEKQSLQDQEDAIVCSNLDISFVDKGSNSTHQFVYVQSNRHVEALMVEFEGNRTYTDTIEGLEKNSIARASAPLDSVSGVRAWAKGCDRVFG